MKEAKYYIAYGSNLNLPQMKQRCPTANVVGTSEIKGYELLFRGSRTGAYATIEPNEEKKVPVLIWSVNIEDEQALDRYEGYPRFYGKETMEIKVNGISTTAFAYVMSEGQQLGIPSEFYLKTIKQGYEKAGFDPSILDSALQRTKELMESKELKDYEQDSLFSMKWW